MPNPNAFRIVYGVNCTWWDSITKVAHVPGTEINDLGGLPCCPHCGSVLFEMDNEGVWFAQVDKHEASGHPGYRAMIEWARGKCFPNYVALIRAYRTEVHGNA